MAQLQTVTWRDSRGFTAGSRFYVTGATLADANTAAVAVITAMDALTTLAVQSERGPSTGSPTEATYPTPAQYQDVEDKVVFTFQTATGANHRYKIPGPKAAIFLADGKTADPANTLVTAFTSAVVANVTDSAGNAVAFGGAGTRTRVKTKRKLSTLTLNPQLTTPDL